MNLNNKCILIIEDEAHIAEGIKINLEMLGHKVVLAENGKKGLEEWEKGGIDLILLDLMLPVLDGNKVLSKIRARNEKVPILILSAKDLTSDKIECFKEGVDDYLVKPFDLSELLLRIKRLLKKSEWIVGDTPQSQGEENIQMDFGPNKINLKTGRAQTLGGQIHLTSQEIKLLKLFDNFKNTPISRKQLLKEGWAYQENVSTRTVDNFIVRFRKYFEIDPKKPIYFKSVRSVGYIFVPDGKNGAD
jgi:two-component system, OmpR family, alkaline phosphatase synthesis response regulator PhoP